MQVAPAAADEPYSHCDSSSADVDLLQLREEKLADVPVGGWEVACASHALASTNAFSLLSLFPPPPLPSLEISAKQVPDKLVAQVGNLNMERQYCVGRQRREDVVARLGVGCGGDLCVVERSPTLFHLFLFQVCGAAPAPTQAHGWILLWTVDGWVKV